MFIMENIDFFRLKNTIFYITFSPLANLQSIVLCHLTYHRTSGDIRADCLHEATVAIRFSMLRIVHRITNARRQEVNARMSQFLAQHMLSGDSRQFVPAHLSLFIRTVVLRGELSTDVVLSRCYHVARRAGP